MRNRVLNIIAFTHILVPHLNQQINQICTGYSWPSDFFSIRKDLNIDYSIDYLKEKSTKYLGFELIKIDYDKLYSIVDLGKQSIVVHDLDNLLDYFISNKLFLKVNDSSTYVEDEEYFKDVNGHPMDILQYSFRTHGADPEVNERIKKYYNKYVSEYVFDESLAQGGRFVRVDKFVQRERDLKLKILLGK